MWKFAVLSLVLLVTSLGACSRKRIPGDKCIPGDNCKLPDCRCWDDPSIPGGLDVKDVPQMVIVSFLDHIDRSNVDSYTGLFDGLANPNKCTPKGTFFVDDGYTNYTLVKSLYNAKHEVGLTTPTGAFPQSPKEWKTAYATMKAKLAGAGIPADRITGSRAPSLLDGGDDQFDAVTKSKLEYDSSCPNLQYSNENVIWPYTYDYVENTPRCDLRTPSKSYPGKWQFMVPCISFGMGTCCNPSSCYRDIFNIKDVFNFFHNAFSKHYESNTRPPFVMYIDSAWLDKIYHEQGTKQFLDFIRSSYNDTWIVTIQQALAWIKNPVTSAEAKDFKPWAC